MQIVKIYKQQMMQIDWVNEREKTKQCSESAQPTK